MKKKTDSKKEDGKQGSLRSPSFAKANEEVSHSHSKATRKKKTKKSEEKKETKLEEEIKEAEKEIEQDFFEEPIRQIPLSAETKAPVLERIIQRETPMQNPIEIEPFGEAREEAKINYSSTNEPNYGFARNKEKEKKYETNFVPPVLTRREFSTENMRREFLKSPEQTWNSQTNEQQLDDIDFIQEETRLPFEEQQKKYKRARLR